MRGPLFNFIKSYLSNRHQKVNKCRVLSVGDSGLSNYIIDNITLNNINSYTDLGIINNKLDFSFHINKICKKAYNVTNILFRCFSIVNFKFILKAFITYVRPIVEYNSSLWNPSKRNSMNCVKLEKVQRRFTKRLFSICNLGLIMIKPF